VLKKIDSRDAQGTPRTLCSDLNPTIGIRRAQSVLMTFSLGTFFTPCGWYKKKKENKNKTENQLEGGWWKNPWRWGFAISGLKCIPRFHRWGSCCYLELLQDQPLHYTRWFMGVYIMSISGKVFLTTASHWGTRIGKGRSLLMAKLTANGVKKTTAIEMQAMNLLGAVRTGKTEPKTVLAGHDQRPR